MFEKAWESVNDIYYTTAWENAKEICEFSAETLKGYASVEEINVITRCKGKFVDSWIQIAFRCDHFHDLRLTFRINGEIGSNNYVSCLSTKSINATKRWMITYIAPPYIRDSLIKNLGIEDD